MTVRQELLKERAAIEQEEANLRSEDIRIHDQLNKVYERCSDIRAKLRNVELHEIEVAKSL